MAVLRKKHKSNFTTIDNSVFQGNLSLKARGLLCTMLSLPDNWNFTEKGLQSILPEDGQNSVRTAIKELENNGFLTRKRERDNHGHIIDCIWTFYDYPGAFLEEPDLENPRLDNPSLNLEIPSLENPNLDTPNLENQQQLNTKEESTNESNTNESLLKEGTTDTKCVYGKHGQRAVKEPETKKAFGEYKNVLLDDKELTKLQAEFPTDWEQRIERLSTYMESTGKRYKNYLATIRNWALSDKAKQVGLCHIPTESTSKSKTSNLTQEDLMKKYGIGFLTANEILCTGGGVDTASLTPEKLVNTYGSDYLDYQTAQQMLADGLF